MLSISVVLSHWLTIDPMSYLDESDMHIKMARQFYSNVLRSYLLVITLRFYYPMSLLIAPMFGGAYSPIAPMCGEEFSVIAPMCRGAYPPIAPICGEASPLIAPMCGGVYPPLPLCVEGHLH